MRMNRTYKAAPIIVIFALILFSSSVIVASQAVDYTKIGVKVGDRADYSRDGSGYDRLGLSVTEVTGVFVNITYTYYWSNGTVVHVSSGRGNVSKGDMVELLVCGGLQADDPLYQGATVRFNNTVSMGIAGATRTVNEIIIFGDEHIYYDQQTGIFAKLVDPGGTNYTMISTNMWGPINPMVLILIGGGVAAVAVVAVVAILIRRRGK